MKRFIPKENGLMGEDTRPRRCAGFTLIELLVVIAIISIIAAIIFPVFFSVKEKARQGIVFDNYRQISSALARYQTENHRYPDVLFGYAVAGKSMDEVKPVGSLYPLYINDPKVFTDPNNPVSDPTLTQTIAGNTFYTADAFDANPIVNSGGTIGPTAVVRYQTTRVAFPASGDTPAAIAAIQAFQSDPNNLRQLANPNAPADTFVTCTTYHAGSGIGQGKVLVLFESGSAKTMDDSKFLAAAGGTDGAGTTFWKVTP